MNIASGIKKKLIIAGVVVALAGGGITAALNQPQKSGADTSPLTTEVDRQGQELQNHDARITNTENDVKDLQNNTNTAPSSNHVSVPTANTTQVITSTTSTTTAPAPAPAPSTPTPVTVTASGYNAGGQYDGYCTLTYSDGSHTNVKATLTTTQTANGGSTSNNCQDFIGQAQ